MGKIIGIDPDYDYLYDPQQAPSYGFCEKCGREIYKKGESLCAECRDDALYEQMRRIRECR